MQHQPQRQERHRQHQCQQAEVVHGREHAEQVHAGHHRGDHRPHQERHHARCRIVLCGEERGGHRGHHRAVAAAFPSQRDPQHAVAHQRHAGAERGEQRHAVVDVLVGGHAFGADAVVRAVQRRGAMVDRVLQGAAVLPQVHQLLQTQQQAGQLQVLQVAVHLRLQCADARAQAGVLAGIGRPVEPVVDVVDQLRQAFRQRLAIAAQRTQAVGDRGQHRQQQQHALAQALHRHR